VELCKPILGAGESCGHGRPFLPLSGILDLDEYAEFKKEQNALVWYPFCLRHGRGVWWFWQGLGGLVVLSKYLSNTPGSQHPEFH
jgi:hypothetical protein